MRRRSFLKGLAVGAAAGVTGLRAPVVLGQAKPFSGITINGAAFQHVHHNYLTEYIPEFEARTGMKVNFSLQ
ncbi:MAG TPA: twin-arginine translocation signal domain-containing protein, partial [Candidatus Methylomirabilis sp.]|nr:twin-arginine translocation signal domain-containing protein [Candidatus Methylomirabilis sp.]